MSSPLHVSEWLACQPSLPNLTLRSRLGLMRCATVTAKYVEFHDRLSERRFRAAASILANVLASDMAPRWFVVQLLLDSLPLLEHPEIVFDAAQVRLHPSPLLCQALR